MAAYRWAYHREVPDQLDLSLTGDVARLPRSLRPMLPKPADAAFDSDEHLFEPRWGGRRDPCLHRRRPIRTESATSSARRARARPGAPSARAGGAGGPRRRPACDPRRRDRGPRSDSAAWTRKRWTVASPTARPRARRRSSWPSTSPGPAGRPIIAQPLLRRRERLARIVQSSAELVVLPGVVHDGMDLYFAVAVSRAYMGVMARHLRSPYLPGRRSDLWRWIRRTAGRDPVACRTGSGRRRPRDRSWR